MSVGCAAAQPPRFASGRRAGLAEIQAMLALAEHSCRETPAPLEESASERLKAYLHAFWLRPENALWMALRSMTLAEVAWPAPAVDLSCGDGVFSFLHLGGRLDPRFDVFCAVDH